MYTSGGHGKLVCSCGALIAQCRCIDHGNDVQIIKGACPECKRKKAWAVEVPVAEYEKRVGKGMKQYIGISRDHSGSMNTLRHAALKDYNDNIVAIQSAAKDKAIDTIVSVVRCGIKSGVDRETVNSNVQAIKPLSYYDADGSTPLFDSVGELIDLLSAVPDRDDPNVSFLVMAVTDGEENHSRTWTGQRLSAKIRELQATDRWTFVFRVPRGYSSSLVRLGIPAGNIQEWETTERGMRESSAQTVSAFSNYYAQRSVGVRSTTAFYADMSNVTKKDVDSTMTNISSEVRIWPVKTPDVIASFVSQKAKKPYRVGTAFYQLTKPEKAVQDYKLIVIRSKSNGAVYAGQSARDLLGLPTTGSIKLIPGDHGDWDIYIQSTSTNRNLIAGTNVLYWEHAK